MKEHGFGFVSKESVLAAVKTLTYLEDVYDKETLERVIDVINRIPIEAKLYRCGSSVTISNEAIRYCGNVVKNRATQSVLEGMSAELYKNGIVNIEEISEPMHDQVRLLANVYALKLKEEGERNETC